MPVKYVYLDRQHQSLMEPLLEAARGVLSRADFILGGDVERLEKTIAAACGRPFGIGVNSGTDALLLGLKVLGIRPGDEVVVPPNSFIATASAPALLGARVRFCDVAADENMDPEALMRVLSPATRAVIVVHLRGRPARMTEFQQICRMRNLFLLEDAAQAIGARWQGKPVGSFGVLGCLSLHPLKNLGGCGDGGLIVGEDPVLEAELRLQRNIGLKNRDEAVRVAGNSRLDTLQAALVNVKAAAWPAWEKRRRAIAARYDQAFGLSLGRIPDREGEYSVYHAYVLHVENRTAVQAFLTERGIESKVHYPISIPDQVAFAGGVRDNCSVSDFLTPRMLSLPIDPMLTDAEVDQVIEALQQAVRSGLARPPQGWDSFVRKALPA